jgi:hypothetical protein
MMTDDVDRKTNGRVKAKCPGVGTWHANTAERGGLAEGAWVSGRG